MLIGLEGRGKCCTVICKIRIVTGMADFPDVLCINALCTPSRMTLRPWIVTDQRSHPEENMKCLNDYKLTPW